jgi:phage shock protein A
MAESLLGKIKVLVSASLHSLLDRALETNSLAVFDEYIRQAQAAMETLKAALVDISVTVKTLRAKYDSTADEAASIDLQIDAALKSGKNVVAKALQVKLNSELDIAHTYKDQYEKQSTTYNTLMEIVQVLQSKVDVLTLQRSQVETLLQLVKSKNVVAKSIKDVQSITDDRVKGIVENVRSQLDVADARLEVATTRLSDQIDQEVGDASLNAQLEQRRQRLGLS